MVQRTWSGQRLRQLKITALKAEISKVHKDNYPILGHTKCTRCGADLRLPNVAMPVT